MLMKTDDQISQINETIENIFVSHKNFSSKTQIFSNDLQPVKNNAKRICPDTTSENEIKQLNLKLNKMQENLNKSQSNYAKMDQKFAELVNYQYIALAGVSTVLIIILFLNIACVIRNSQCKKNLSLEQDVMCQEFEEKLTLNKLRKLYTE